MGEIAINESFYVDKRKQLDMYKEYIAHKDLYGNVQTVKEHGENTARLAGEYSIDCFRDICNSIGLY